MDPLEKKMTLEEEELDEEQQINLESNFDMFFNQKNQQSQQSQNKFYQP